MRYKGVWLTEILAGAFLAAASSGAADLQSYSISKQETFNQLDSGTPTLGTYIFFGGINPHNPVTNANLQLPNGTNYTLNGANKYHVRQTFLTQAALDSAFSSGPYTITAYGTLDGYHVLDLTLPTDSFPSAPRISDFTAVQAINPALNFDFVWDAFTNAGPLDNISLTVYDAIGDVLVAATLTNTATSYQIGANTLPTGKNDYATLTFTHGITNDATTYPGATGMVFFASQTLFNIAFATNAISLNLRVLPADGAGAFRLQLVGQTNQSYVIEAAPGLSGLWAPLVTNITSDGEFIFTDKQSSIFPVRFYRGRQSNP